jgi:hypothetical protein
LGVVLREKRKASARDDDGHVAPAREEACGGAHTPLSRAALRPAEAPSCALCAGASALLQLGAGLRASASCAGAHSAQAAHARGSLTTAPLAPGLAAPRRMTCATAALARAAAAAGSRLAWRGALAPGAGGAAALLHAAALRGGVANAPRAAPAVAPLPLRRAGAPRAAFGGGRPKLGKSAKPPKETFLCNECGEDFPQSHGKCPACGAWDRCVTWRAARTRRPRGTAGAGVAPRARQCVCFENPDAVADNCPALPVRQPGALPRAGGVVQRWRRRRCARAGARRPFSAFLPLRRVAAARHPRAARLLRLLRCRAAACAASRRLGGGFRRGGAPGGRAGVRVRRGRVAHPAAHAAWR